MITVAGAAYATARWQPWSPVSACLLCDTRSADSTAVGTTGATPLAGGAAGSYARSSAGVGGAGALVPVPLAPGSEDGVGATSHAASGRRSWQPWGTGSGAFRVTSSSASGPSAPLGGLWRLMSLARPASHGVGNTPQSTHAAAATVTRPTAPGARKPAPPSSPAPGAPSAGTVPPGVGGIAPPPTDTFHDHETPPPDPFGGGTGAPGSLDPGTTGGPHPPSGGGVSATPEPGSLLLVGTGLLGIAGVLRRRRLI